MRYKVGIRKEYFPKELWPQEFGRSYVETFGVLASSRREAAEKIWARHGKRLLAKMLPQTRTRRISLDVNAPGSVGSIGRLHPVVVYEGPDLIGPRLLPRKSF